MNYRQTLDYLFSRLPMFHRIGAAAYKANLDNTISLCRILGNPESKFPSIHVAGTNGKGSVSHMLASILQEAGYKTGLFTSPHLKDFRERIRINGKKIPKSSVTEFLKDYRTLFESFEPSFFEYTFSLAVKYFSDQQVDVAVMETGMGGRLDSTNVVRSVVSVITNISLDHTQFLGETLEKIAAEKAGIIKPGIPVVIGETQQGLRSVFEEAARRNKSPLIFADSGYRVVKSRTEIEKLIVNIQEEDRIIVSDLQCPLTGNYQLKNILTAFRTAEVLKNKGYRIHDQHIYKDIKNVIRNTGIAGRWHILQREPLIICDTGHNHGGMKEVVKQLKEINYRKLHFVIGFVKDKDIGSILSLLPSDAVYYFCKADIPRGLDALELKALCLKSGLSGESYPSVMSALESAKLQFKTGEMIFIGGSTFVVAEIL
jgi:dihydrofolate synthase/folylpolyglutamate synthase